MRRPYRYLIREEYKDGETYESLFRSLKKARTHYQEVSNNQYVHKVSFTDLWDSSMV